MVKSLSKEEWLDLVNNPYKTVETVEAKPVESKTKSEVPKAVKKPSALKEV